MTNADMMVIFDGILYYLFYDKDEKGWHGAEFICAGRGNDQM